MKFALCLLAFALLAAFIGWYLTVSPLPASDSGLLLRDDLLRMTGQ